MKETGRPGLYRFWTPNYWPLWILLGLLRLIIMLPHSARLKVGFAIGRLGHWAIASRRAVTRRNIELCFPDLSEEERNKLARAHFESLGASFIEMGLGTWASDEELLKLTKVEGTENITKHTDKGVGVILVSAHFTTLEISGRILSTMIPPFDVVYRDHKNPMITAILRGNRERSVRRVIEKNDIRQMVRSLREGVAVWYAPDQSYSGKQSAVLPFFGVPCMTNTAMGNLGKLGRAVAVPYFPHRLADGTYKVSILPALEDFPADDVETDALRYNQMLEQGVMVCPEQYYWIHKKFKNLPEPHENYYANIDHLK